MNPWERVAGRRGQQKLMKAKRAIDDSAVVASHFSAEETEAQQLSARGYSMGLTVRIGNN
jgi:hypothetical protein